MLLPNFNLYKAEWLDLVFDNRNKNYGAYELRSHYAETMTKAISITVVAVVGAAISFSIIAKRPHLAVDQPTLNDTTIVHIKDIKQIKPDKPLEVKPPAAAPKVNTVVIPTHVTANEPKAIDPPTQTQLSTAIVGPETIKGPEVTGNIAPTTTTGTGTGVESVSTGADDGTVHDFAEVSPEPNGGMAGWTKFLQRNLRYPDTEVQGRVLISFVVERDGSLTDIKLVRSVDHQLDAEALRVLKIAPKWKPGMQSGKPVRVQFTLPINFQLGN